jgi:hypothetical protein
MEEEAPAVRAFWEDGSNAGTDPGDEESLSLSRRAGNAVERAVHTGRESVSNLSTGGRIVAGTALLGVAAGLVLAGCLRKR